MRILAIDYGSKRTGLAMSDPLGITAQPLKTVPTEKLVCELLELHEEYELDKLIMGLPIRMTGEEGLAAENIRKVKSMLEKKTKLVIELVDERLSTSGMQKTLIEGDVSRAKRKLVIDKLAATYLLQGYLARTKQKLQLSE